MFLFIIRKVFGSAGSSKKDVETSAPVMAADAPRENRPERYADENDGNANEGRPSSGREPLRFASDGAEDSADEADADSDGSVETGERSNREQRTGRNSRPNRDSRNDRDADAGDDEDEVIQAQTQSGDPMAEMEDVDEVEEQDSRRFGRNRRDEPARNRMDSAKEFFSTEMLYLYDLLLPEERDALQGSYRIELKGYQGGIWTVKVGKQIEVVNTREEADVVFSMQQSDFMEIINGELNPQLALLAQKVKLSGDVKKAVRFQSLLAPSEE